MPLGRSDRAVSESMGVAALIGITVVVTLSLGIGVLFVEGDDSQADLEFNFIYSDAMSQLTIQYQDDEELPVGEVYVHGPANNLSWAELVPGAPDDDEPITAYDTVFVQSENYGTNVDEEDYFEIIYDGEVVAHFNEPDEEDGPGDPLEPDEPEPDGPGP